MRLPTENDIRFPDPVESGLSMSEDVDKIATALNRAIAKIYNAPKTTKGYGYNYAVLEDVLDIIKEAFEPNGLFLMQFPWTPSEDTGGVITLVTHSSGQWISSQFAIRIDTRNSKNHNQAFGALLTYMRRYSAMGAAFMNGVGEDFDGLNKDEKKDMDGGRKEEKKEEKKNLEVKTPIQARTLELLTEAAVKGVDDLTSAYNGLTDHQQDNLTSMDKAYLKDVARGLIKDEDDANVNPS